MEAIDFAFVRSSYQLLKITFWNKQKMVVQKDTFLQTWQDVCIFSCLSSPKTRHQLLLLLQQIIFLQQKKNQIMSLSLDQLSFVANFRECVHLFLFLCRIKWQKNFGNIIFRRLTSRFIKRYQRNLTTFTSLTTTMMFLLLISVALPSSIWD